MSRAIKGPPPPLPPGLPPGMVPSAPPVSSLNSFSAGEGTRSGGIGKAAAAASVPGSAGKRFVALFRGEKVFVHVPRSVSKSNDFMTFCNIVAVALSFASGSALSGRDFDRRSFRCVDDNVMLGGPGEITEGETIEVTPKEGAMDGDGDA